MIFDLNFIKNRREELGISRKDMASLLGFSNASVYWKYEKGEYKFKAEILPRLAFVLKCNTTNFFTVKS